ncbi:hypothetical protein BV22DRAFT_1038452, partial [Leucogyrophana mollusca]
MTEAQLFIQFLVAPSPSFLLIHTQLFSGPGSARRTSQTQASPVLAPCGLIMFSPELPGGTLSSDEDPHLDGEMSSRDDARSGGEVGLDDDAGSDDSTRCTEPITGVQRSRRFMV